MLENKRKVEFTPERGIQTFFQGTTLFLTGVTGYIGQVLLSKLLCSCPDIENIYVLIRQKKGKDVNSRLREIFNTPIFEKVKKCYPDYSSKVIAIEGDCSFPNLGISETDRNILLEHVNIVFHIAATVNFEAPLREAVNINVRSTSDLLDFAKDMKNLQVFVHVSTCFSFCAERKIIEERMYEPPMHPQEIISLVENSDDTVLKKITPRLLGPYPNTYVLTKAIAESLCLYKNPGLPITIFRPAIVISTAEDPIPGWINNLYGPTGIVAASGIGLMRTLHVNGKNKANLVPCDYVINAMIASAWYTAETWKTSKTKNTYNNYAIETPQVPVFNYSSSEMKNALTWEMLHGAAKVAELEAPFPTSAWSFSMTMNKHKFMHLLYVTVLHTIPALVIDAIALICGKQARLRETYHKIHRLGNAISYFSTREWIIPHDNVMMLWSRLSEHDKQIFKFNLDDLEWKIYLKDYIHGVRLYFIKNKEQTLPYVIKKKELFIPALYALIAFFIYAIIRFY